MATVTKSIGATARDYSTITLWEADLDDAAIYSASDDAVGECYNDNPFDEAVTINGGGTVGLNLATLSVASGERHDGTAGTGARMLATDDIYLLFLDGPSSGYEIEWFEFDANGYFSGSANYGVIGGNDSGAPVLDVRNCLAHGVATTGWGKHANGIVSGWSSDHTATNCVVYDLASTNAVSNGKGIGSRHAGGGLHKHYNCTVHDVTTGSSSGVGFNQNGSSSCTSQNCISTGCDTDFDITNGTLSYDASSDATATGTGSITSITTADQYVSTVGGSEDLHLKAGSDCIDAGTDLGTTPTGVNIDINGRDRDAEADTWDIGAHEFIAAAATTTSVGWTRSLTPSPVRPSYKSGFARSAAESAAPGLWKGMYSGGMGSQLYDIAARQPVSFYSNTADRIVGEHGEAWHFNDTRNGEAITLGHLGNTWLDGATEFTYGLAFRYHGTDSSDGDCLMGQWAHLQGSHDNEAKRAFFKYNSHNKKIQWELDDGNREYMNVVTSIEDDGWHVVIHRFTSGAHTGWIDGALVATDSTPGTTIQSTVHGKVPEIIGGQKVTHDSKNSGRFDVAAWWIWDRAITPTEIRQVSNDPLSPFRLRRFTPTISGAAEEVAEWQPYWAPRMTQRIIGSGVR